MAVELYLLASEKCVADFPCKHWQPAALLKQLSALNSGMHSTCLVPLTHVDTIHQYAVQVHSAAELAEQMELQSMALQPNKLHIFCLHAAWASAYIASVDVLAGTQVMELHFAALQVEVQSETMQSCQAIDVNCSGIF